MLAETVPDVAVIPANLQETALIGHIRTNQIRTSLIRLYGPPRASLSPGGDRSRQETLVALLFAPASRLAGRKTGA